MRVDKLQEEMTAAFLELAEVREEINESKSIITIQMLGRLMQTLQDTADDFMQGMSESMKGKEDVAEKFSTALKESLVSAVAEFAKVNKAVEFKPEFKPVINMNLDPLKAVTEQILEHNKNILSWLKKKDDESSPDFQQLYGLVAAMIERNNEFISTTFKSNDYSAYLKTISESIGAKNGRIEKLNVVYGEYGRINYVTPVYQK